MGCCCSDESVNINDFDVIIDDRSVNNASYTQQYVDDLDVRGRWSWTVDLRSSPESNERKQRPYVPSGEMWTDPDFPLSVAIRDHSKLDWKRPHDIVKYPVLFSRGASRFDIRQKFFGTCWFLTMMANLAEKPDLCRKVINENSYTPETDGVCHCRLWRFGVWEDVFTDDHLPVYVAYGRYQFHGAMSGTDVDEMWVPFLEKSLARLHGSYNVVSDEGGYPSDAFLTLTGGVAERVTLSPDLPDPYRLFRRIRNALRAGALICCGVPRKHDGYQGLVGGHAYSLTGADVVKKRNGEQVPLVRIRNPHGTNEWEGKWSDRSVEWADVVEGENLRRNRDDGEFWMSFDDFLQYYANTYICSVTPDFDLDGRSDPLSHVLNIYGEWRGATAVGEGRSMRTRLRNPRLEITVPKEGMTDDGYVPVVIQLIQKAEHLDYGDGIRCDLFMVYYGRENSRTVHLKQVADIEYKEYYYSQLQCCFRYRLRPGRYIIIPSTYERGKTRQFLLRVFTPCPIPVFRKIVSTVQLIPRR